MSTLMSPVNSTTVPRQNHGQPLQCQGTPRPPSLQLNPHLWRPSLSQSQQPQLQLPSQPQAWPWSPSQTWPIETWTVPSTAAPIPVITTSRLPSSARPRRGSLKVARWLTDPSCPEKCNTLDDSPVGDGQSGVSKDSDPTRSTFSVWPSFLSTVGNYLDPSVRRPDEGQDTEPNWKELVTEL